MSNEIHLPLIELFTRLRMAGLPLGIDEYKALLRALSYGFGTPDHTALARLCKLLWIKSAEEEKLFDYHFQALLSIQEEEKPLSVESIGPEEADLSLQPLSEESELPSTPAMFEGSDISAPGASSDLIFAFDDEAQIAQAFQHTVKENDTSEYELELQGDEYFPITRRQMKQA